MTRCPHRHQRPKLHQHDQHPREAQLHGFDAGQLGHSFHFQTHQVVSKQCPPELLLHGPGTEAAQRFLAVQHLGLDLIEALHHTELDLDSFLPITPEDFYRAHNFSLPGEKYGAPEVVVRHDLTHVIGGYETDHDGEAQVLAFQAGGRRESAMEVLVFLMFQVQVGVRVVNLAEPSAGFLHNEESGRKVARAFLRGSAMTLDLLGDWDFKSAFHRPLEELRREYNVLPESASADA